MSLCSQVGKARCGHFVGRNLGDLPSHPDRRAAAQITLPPFVGPTPPALGSVFA